ncbi:hypothetical protein ACKI1I_34110 [Streptomyces turgidiscabies]|uniref:Uncharacterized protein n=1 Tax=Streptomyces turgidiscabies (strain Car8) TaxID=698760 RepID=L7EWZ8_STRT8|nr:MULTISPECIES: hypothetical protein [Streptomyces]ELP63938.1 hypothetical protein STRTUCAR8_04670 [Streptomyces turgidiscabies Car8]MDX3498663.1 hypothetical protein [Streptomyces turgidiscabies]GAQ74913.1 hypothetical protein T45_06694 [Streptomyces turgidiscabies]
MNARTTPFEERLLAELQREIGLREGESAKAEAGEGGTHSPVRRVLTPRRIALAAAACAVAGLAAVVVPGTPAESVAYAVESHGDGSVTLTFNEVRIDRDAQYELARELQPNGIEVDVEVLPPGYSCKKWGNVAALELVEVGDDDDARTPVSAWHVPVRVTLSRGNVLVFENSEGRAEPQAVHAYEIGRYELDSTAAKAESEARSKPCVPVKPTP